MNVYRVKVTYETVVVAGNPASACNTAEFAIRNWDEASTCEATHIDKLNDLPDGWTLDCIPWGAKGAKGAKKDLRELLGYTKHTI